MGLIDILLARKLWGLGGAGGEVKPSDKADIKFVGTMGEDGQPVFTVETEIENVYEFLLQCLRNGVMPKIIISMVAEIEGNLMASVYNAVSIGNIEGFVTVGFAGTAGVDWFPDNTFEVHI